MSPPGRLYLCRVHGAPLLFLLGLLPALLLLGAQGLPGAGLLPSAAHIARGHLDYGSLKPAAHLTGDPRTTSWLRWKANTGQGFFLNGFSLSNNSLLVPTSGLYFVYSQVVFSGLSNSSKPIYLSHEVRVFTSRYSPYLPLLSTHKNVDPDPEGHWMRSMYQGALFLLTKGDQLYTHTQGLPYLLLSPSSVFFGAFAL